ncbi:hypothetical protein P7K49_023905 [Saguinus oedipus]|uniref:Uncharacterized protein n=1 Tax=Saguinus oedipus TaxID=9490 RepID=A0ABQ9UNS0_SAGOE|nr:hypothetical protein P7K49_023905 [Saguinus oedipus]
MNVNQSIPPVPPFGQPQPVYPGYHQSSYSGQSGSTAPAIPYGAYNGPVPGYQQTPPQAETDWTESTSALLSPDLSNWSLAFSQEKALLEENIPDPVMVYQEPPLLQGHLQPQQHRLLVARLHMASLAKEMYRMGQAPLFRCKEKHLKQMQNNHTSTQIGKDSQEGILIRPFGSPLAPVGSQPAVLRPYGPPPTSTQVTAQLAGMQISGAVAPAPPSSGLGYGE